MKNFKNFLKNCFRRFGLVVIIILFFLILGGVFFYSSGYLKETRQEPQSNPENDIVRIPEDSDSFYKEIIE